MKVLCTKYKKLGIWLFVTILLVLCHQYNVFYCIHEGGHALVAIIAGIPLSEIEFQCFGSQPHVTVSLPSYFGSVFYYAGGFIAGTLLLILYSILVLLTYRLHFRSNEKDGAAMLAIPATSYVFAWVSKEYVNGYFEGLYQGVYQDIVGQLASNVFFIVLPIYAFIVAITFALYYFKHGVVHDEVINHD